MRDGEITQVGRYDDILQSGTDWTEGGQAGQATSTTQLWQFQKDIPSMRSVTIHWHFLSSLNRSLVWYRCISSAYNCHRGIKNVLR